IQNHACRSARRAELGTHNWQRRAGICGIVGETHPAYAIPRLVFMPNTGNERVLSRLPDGKKHFQGSGCDDDDGAVSKADPPPLVLSKKLVAGSPIRRLIPAPVGMDLL